MAKGHFQWVRTHWKCPYPTLTWERNLSRAQPKRPEM